MSAGGIAGVAPQVGAQPLLGHAVSIDQVGVVRQRREATGAEDHDVRMRSQRFASFDEFACHRQDPTT